MLNAASISKYLGFNACIPVQGITVLINKKNKNGTIIGVSYIKKRGRKSSGREAFGKALDKPKQASLTPVKKASAFSPTAKSPSSKRTKKQSCIIEITLNAIT